MPYGLGSLVIARMQSVFAHYPQIDKAILYGSRAMGNYRPGSDIDITLQGEALSADTLVQVAGELDDLLLPYTIDLSLLAQLDNPALLDHIQRVGVELYVRQDTALSPTSSAAPVHSPSRR